MRLEYREGRYVLLLKQSERAVARQAGFTFDLTGAKHWYTTDWKIAVQFIHAATGEAQARLKAHEKKLYDALEASLAMFSDYSVPVPDIYHPRTGEKLDYLPYQKAGILYAADRKYTLIGDPPGLGKGQPLDEPVLCPDGWRDIGSLNQGDPIIGSDGKTYAVTGIFDKGILPVYRVEFNDGSSTVVDGDHLWKVRRRKESNGWQPDWEVIDTRTLIERAYPSGIASNKIEIPLVLPVEHPEADLPLDPYVMGVLLGDGSIKYSSYVSIEDSGILDEFQRRLPNGYRLRKSGDGNDWHIAREGRQTTSSEVKQALRDLGLFGKGSDDKFIPASYLFSSVQQRILLLGGLMDTDGYCAKDGTTQFTSNSLMLADGVASLVNSLGGTVKRSSKISASGKRHYVVTLNSPICPFLYCKRKVDRWKPRVKYPPKRIFKSITELPPVVVRCISVSAPDELYVTRDHIVTHNTIQAVGIINNHSIQSGLIFCPSGLKYNWKKELEKWLVDKTLTVGIAEGNNIPATDFVIINYDIAHRNYDELIREEWGIIVCDESQVLSNGDAKRTMAILGKRFANKFKQRPLRAWKWVFLSGTPITKQPIQLWPIIQHCDPNGLGRDWNAFVFKYCDAVMTPFGLDTTGGSNLSEFNEKLRLAFMVRRLKKHVLKHLPPKNRHVIILPEEGLSNLIQTERDCFANALAALEAMNEEIERTDITRLEDIDPGYVLDQMATIHSGSFDSVGDQLDQGDLVPEFSAYSEARKELGLAKLPMVMEIIERLIAEGHKVLVFAIHKEVIARMYERWPQSARIIGGMTAKKVDKEKVRFQGWDDEGVEPDPTCDRILLNIKAGGVGHTLTKGTKIVMAELWAVPGDVEQCEDRAHRIGQTQDVDVYYPVVNGTMDAMTIQSLIYRIEMIENAIDG